MKAGLSIQMSDLKVYKKTNLHMYQSLIEKLIYFLCNTRPDILFVIRQLNKYNTNLKKGHLLVAKRVIRYLKENIKMRLIFGQKSVEELPRDLFSYRLIGYVDNNFARDLKDQKSVISFYFFLNRAVVSWSSKKQKIVSISTTKTEYIVISHVDRKVFQLRRFIKKMK